MQHPWITKAGDKKVVVKLLEECMPKIDANREAPPHAAGGGDASAAGEKVKSGPIKPSGTLTKALEAAEAKKKAEAAANNKSAAAPPSANAAPATGGGGTLKIPVQPSS